MLIYGPRHEKTNILHMRKQSEKSVLSIIDHNCFEFVYIHRKIVVLVSSVFFPRTISMWNSLPSSVVSSKTIEEFKAQI